MGAAPIPYQVIDEPALVLHLLEYLQRIEVTTKSHHLRSLLAFLNSVLTDSRFLHLIFFFRDKCKRIQNSHGVPAGYQSGHYPKKALPRYHAVVCIIYSEVGHFRNNVGVTTLEE